MNDLIASEHHVQIAAYSSIINLIRQEAAFSRFLKNPYEKISFALIKYG